MNNSPDDEHALASPRSVAVERLGVELDDASGLVDPGEFTTIVSSTSPGRHRVEIEVSHRTPERTFYRVTFRGELFVTHWDPERAACRKLLAMGIKGELRTRWKGAAHDAMVLDIERAAAVCTMDGRSKGPVTIRFREFSDGARDGE